MSNPVTESYITVPPDSDGKRLRSLNYSLSGQNAAQSVWSEVIHVADPQSGAYIALVNASGALSVSTSGDAVSVSGNIVGVYAASQQSGWMAVISGVGATSGQVQVASSGLGTVAVSSGSVIPVMAASFQSGGSVAVSGVGATSGQLNIASSGFGTVAIASGGIIPISIISGNVVALSGIVEIVSGQTVTVVSSGIGTIAVSSGGVIPTMLASAQSGGLVGISGGGLTVSGGVTVSGSVMISGVGNTSGQLNIASSGLGTVAVSSGGTLPVGLTGYQSGVLVGISGGSVGLSGLQGVAISGSVTVLPNAYQSGQLVALSGGGAGISGVAVQVFTSGGQNVVIAGSGQVPIISVTSNVPSSFSSGQALAVLPTFSNAGSTLLRPWISVGDAGDAAPTGTVPSVGFFLRNGSAGSAGLDTVRSIAGSSGGSLGVLAIQQVGYSYKNFTGATITNVKSGAAFLHSVVINSFSSGLSFQIFDSASGATGNSLGVINPDAGSLTNAALAPTALIYDCLMTSGIVASSSGANWDVTILWRTATS